MTYFFNPALPGALPPVLPLFPLPGILLLPGGELPLNIFEDRYIAMVDHVLGTPNRMIGIIQTRPDAADTRGNDLYSVGCAGRVTSFHETEDGRYMITLAGVCRFHVNTEIEQMSGFRCIVPNFDHFLPHDAAKETAETPLDRMRLIALLRDYFDTEGMTCKW